MTEDAAFFRGQLARPLRHRQSRKGVTAAWEKIARTVYSPRILQGLPAFATPLARSFWGVEALQVIQAIKNGDVAFFVAYQIRLDQLDCAMVAIGRTIADRAPLTRIKYLLEGFRQTAETQLVKKGGVWPPSAVAPEESPA